jgi:glycosyltransferase involved in cell wall biosynthesis
MPGVLIEAGLASLPVVTTRVPGASDVVEHEGTGFVVSVDDVEGLITNVSRLVNDAELRVKLGDRARVRCEAKFGMDNNLAQWRKLIDDVCQGACERST